MNEDFDIFNRNFGPRFASIQADQAIIEAYTGKLPASLLAYWSEVGFSGYADGVLWVTNPAELRPAVDAWCDAANILDAASYHAYARSAFGDLFLWHQRHGPTAIIHPLAGSVTVTKPNRHVVAGDGDLVIETFFSSRAPGYFDFDDAKGKPLFKRALKKLGTLANDEMYAFVPALPVGGMPTLAHLAKEKMLEHLVLLAQMTDPEVISIDFA